jgi:transposase-like protein
MEPDKKEALIKKYLLGGYSYRQMEREYGIKRSVLNRWVLNAQGIPHSQSGSRKTVVLPVMPKKSSEESSTHVEQLQKQLDQQKLNNKLLTALIDIAEKELNIQIRKKSGTKRSSK